MNSNGVFVNVSCIDFKVIDEIKKYINFCLRNNEILKKKEEEAKKEQRYIENYHKSIQKKKIRQF